jgi:hypothetical protein
MKSPSTATTTTIHRPLGGLTGYRLVYDRASRAVVHAFPLADLAAVAAAGLLKGVCAYVLVGGGMAYFGESGRPAKRLAKHSRNPHKAFALDAFVVAGDESWFDRSIALDFQFRLTNQAEDAGVVTVVKGNSPAEPYLSAADRSTHDRIYDDALQLLHDAGCRIFQPAAGVSDERAEAAPASQEQVAAENGGDSADSGPMAIGVNTGEEYELRYCGLWSRGYPSGGRFVVAAGSEVRAQTNGSVDDLTRKRRKELFRADVLEEIAGAADRRRLTVAVAFATQSIAAKVVCGAHSAPRWTPLAARAVVLAT